MAGGDAVSARRPRTPRLSLRVFRVTVAAHRVERWDIPASTGKLPAADESHACEIAVRNLHREAGVPPWHPCIRQSLRHATAVRARSPHR
jgi:hypothetical protein